MWIHSPIIASVCSKQLGGAIQFMFLPKALKVLRVFWHIIIVNSFLFWLFRVHLELCISSLTKKGRTLRDSFVIRFLSVYLSWYINLRLARWIVGCVPRCLQKIVVSRILIIKLSLIDSEFLFIIHSSLTAFIIYTQRWIELFRDSRVYIVKELAYYHRPILHNEGCLCRLRVLMSPATVDAFLVLQYFFHRWTLMHRFWLSEFLSHNWCFDFSCSCLFTKLIQSSKSSFIDLDWRYLLDL